MLGDTGGFYKSDPVGSFNFVLTVEGMYDIPLKGVRAFTKTNQFERIKEGGVNDYVHLKRAPIQDAHTIQFERYVSGTLVDPLANGAELALPVVLWLKRASNNEYTDARAADKEYNGDFDSSSVRLYIFTGCVVMSKEYGALDAEKSGLATEVVTMAYKELYIVPNLYTFFGGGTDIKSFGQGGELSNSMSESDRKKFEEQRKKDAEKAAEEAAKEREAYEAQKKKEYEAALEKKEEEKKVAEEKEKADKEAAEEYARKAREERAEANAEAAREEAERQEAARQQAEADREARKQENEEVSKQEAEREEKARQDAEEARKAREAANKEQTDLEHADDIRERAKRKTQN